MATDKESLTLEEACREYWQEILAIYPTAVDYGNGHVFLTENGYNIEITEGDLVLTVLRWLAGKKIRTALPDWQEIWTTKVVIDGAIAGQQSTTERNKYWPNTPLRFYLEEVRAQLKQEKA